MYTLAPVASWLILEENQGREVKVALGTSGGLRYSQSNRHPPILSKCDTKNFKKNKNQVLEQIQVRLCEARKDCMSDSFQKKTKRKALLAAAKSSGCCHRMPGVSIHERGALAPASS